jgi:SOS response associated peptidase (SRAP)
MILAALPPSCPPAFDVPAGFPPLRAHPRASARHRASALAARFGRRGQSLELVYGGPVEDNRAHHVGGVVARPAAAARADGQRAAGGKQPFYFRLRDGRPFAFAGLWERWDKGEELIESCAILTTEANAVVRPVHERMPVILPPEDFAAWLYPLGSPAALQALLRPYPAEEMQASAVSRRVNDPRHEGADCLAPEG